MNKDDIEKNGFEKVPLKILIPAYNDYPIKDMKRWAKKAYRKARLQVGWRKAGKIKETMPIETAAYAEDKVFGNWRLVAPDCPDKISPLQKVITLIRDEIVPTRWGEFRRKFICEIKIDFNAICDSDYDPAMVDEVNPAPIVRGVYREPCYSVFSSLPDDRCGVNGRLNQLLTKFTRTTPRPPLVRGNSGKEESPFDKGELELLLPLNKGGIKGGCVHINFVLKPETAEDYSSLRFFLRTVSPQDEPVTIRSEIWMRWTGEPLDFSQFIKPESAPPICRQMEMYLDIYPAPT